MPLLMNVSSNTFPGKTENKKTPQLQVLEYEKPSTHTQKDTILPRLKSFVKSIAMLITFKSFAVKLTGKNIMKQKVKTLLYNIYVV